jgi:hypothetical protein
MAGVFIFLNMTLIASVLLPAIAVVLLFYPGKNSRAVAQFISFLIVIAPFVLRLLSGLPLFVEIPVDEWPFFDWNIISLLALLALIALLFSQVAARRFAQLVLGLIWAIFIVAYIELGRRPMF